MKAVNLFTIPLLCFSITAVSQSGKKAKGEDRLLHAGAKDTEQRINFYVVNKPKSIDLFSRLVIWRARKKSRRSNHDFVVVIASSSEEAKNKVLKKLEKEKGMIGSLWFDSHGHYANGYSSFSLGNDQFSYKTINDTSYTRHLAALAPYCDAQTKIAIGSCYGGATYEKPAHSGKPASRMNGDSLIIGLAHIFPGSMVFGTEGWVMTKPGIFHKFSYALAGYPIQRRFKDEVYRPVWENMGVWHSYTTTTQKFETVNSLSLNHRGTINIRWASYLEREKYKKRLARNLEKIRAGIMKT